MYLYHGCCHYIDFVNKPWVPTMSVPFEDICMHCLWTIWYLWDRNYNIYSFLASSVTSLNKNLDSNMSFFSIFLLIPLLKIPYFLQLVIFFCNWHVAVTPISSKADRKKNNKELLYVFFPITAQDLIHNLSDFSDCFQEKNILIIRSS